MDREFLQTIRVGEDALPEEVIETILSQSRQEETAWQQKLHRMHLEGCLQRSVQQAGGRNVKAIEALLDLDAIGGSEDLQAAMDAAVRDLKARESYLFSGPQAPGYAAGTGSHSPHSGSPMTLAEALRAKFSR